ncbi:hypothetical protein GCM10023335_46840 [Streptomyces siamensis]|uniref:Uncharacterized protein n=1 Tax=Streptomyces siamensis TaxID=1274986 RepID=A0ABP9J4F1_9ACTN
MDDLASAGSLLPIFIRCPGHLDGHAKFGQMPRTGDLSEARAADLLFPRTSGPCDGPGGLRVA